jgi:hypothetical protein
LDAVNNGKIKEVYQSDDFMTRLTPEQIVSATSAIQVADYFSQTLNENKIEDATANNLKKYLLRLLILLIPILALSRLIMEQD